LTTERIGIEPATIKSAIETVGTISPGNIKMECGTWSLPVDFCKTGGLLRNKENTVCSKCYAAKMQVYRKKTLDLSWKRNYDRYMISKAENKRELWINSMIKLINKKKLKHPYFRWFVGGDIPDIEFLYRAMEIADSLPNIKFWLPSKESALIRRFIKNNTIPSNVCIRISKSMINPRQKPKIKELEPIRYSTTFTKEYGKYFGFLCPATAGDIGCYKCGWKCWDKSIDNVTYYLH